ncbi:MAG: NAD(P)H-hydrate dehydratase [Pseudomonadota bacterium]
MARRILTAAQMAASDRFTIAKTGQSGFQLMERASAAVVDVLLRDFVQTDRFVVLAGPGNNGGDGYVIAQILREKGLPLQLYSWGQPKAGTDAELAKARCEVPAEALMKYQADRGDVVIDALFGTGGRADLPTDIKNVFETITQVGARVVAVDVPSGLDADTGVFAQSSAAAEATVTFQALKPGLTTAQSASVCGPIHVADIGVSIAPGGGHDERLWENDPILWSKDMPSANATDHKYARGHVGVFSGPVATSGAARIAATAAQACAAGAVTMLCPDAQTLNLQSQASASLMARIIEAGTSASTAIAQLRRCNACVVGPGFGADNAHLRETVLSLLSPNAASYLETLVLDADVFTAFASNAGKLFDAIQSNTRCDVVMTPHDGEFDRMFPDLAARHLSKPKWKLAQDASDRSGAVIVYKGYDTVIAAPHDVDVIINTNAPPTLAFAGSGDVLAGMISAFASAGMGARDACAAAVWHHASAAQNARHTLTPERLIEELAGQLATRFPTTGQPSTHEI